MGIKNLIFANSLSLFVFGEKDLNLAKAFDALSDFFMKNNIKTVNTAKHADVLMVYGPVSNKMSFFLKDAYDKINKPKWVISCNSHGVLNKYDSYSSIVDLNKILPVNFNVYVNGKEDYENLKNTFIKLKEIIKNDAE